MHKSGRHLMLALAFKNRKDAIDYMENQGRCFVLNIDPETIKERGLWSNSLAATCVEFEVPEELFAQPPKSKLGKLWWKYLFWPKKPKPNDECQVRRNALFYALPKLPVFLSVKFVFAILCLLYALYIIVARPISWFFGWWPITWEEAWERIKDPRAYDWKMNSLGGSSWTRGYLKKFKDDKHVDTMKFAPFVFTFFLLSLLMSILFAMDIGSGLNFLWLILSLISTNLFFSYGRIFRIFTDEIEEIFTISWITFFSIWFIFAIIHNVFFLESLTAGTFAYNLSSALCVIGYIAFGIIILIFLVYFLSILIKSELFKKTLRKIRSKMKINLGKGIEKKREHERRKEQAKAIAKQEELLKAEKESREYQEYLLNFFTKKEEQVNLKNIPSTYKRSSVIRNAKIKFWTTKKKVCRPYEK